MISGDQMKEWSLQGEHVVAYKRVLVIGDWKLRFGRLGCFELDVKLSNYSKISPQNFQPFSFRCPIAKKLLSFEWPKLDTETLIVFLFPSSTANGIHSKDHNYCFSSSFLLKDIQSSLPYIACPPCFEGLL